MNVLFYASYAFCCEWIWYLEAKGRIALCFWDDTQKCWAMTDSIRLIMTDEGQTE